MRVDRSTPARVVKRGALGIRVVGENARELPAREAAVVDTTGAGDALAAGFLVGGPELALEAAARCVAQARSDAVITISDEVREAHAVVALETTLVAHGFPGAKESQSRASRRTGARRGGRACDVGVLDGEIRVGLSMEELERFDA